MDDKKMNIKNWPRHTIQALWAALTNSHISGFVTGKIYTGICVDGACTLGICAERNAIFNMLTNGESEIKRVIAVNWDGKAMPPCGACRELMAQLMPNNYHDIEIMLDCEKNEIVTLGELTPKWWI